MWDIFSCPYFLMLIFNVTTISCPMLRPLSYLTMFWDHNFSLICRFIIQFSQNYKYRYRRDPTLNLLQSLWNKNTIIWVVERSHIHHIFTPYKNIFFPPPDEVGEGGIGVASDARPSASAFSFPEQNSVTRAWISLIFDTLTSYTT